MGFNGTPSVFTREHGGPNDKVPAKLGALSAGGMISPGGLAGTTGIDVALIHGDAWRQTEGNQVVNILKNLTTTITLTEKRTVTQNLVNKVCGTTNDTRIGVHNQTNVAPRNDEFMHTRSEIHHEKENRQQKTEDADVADKAMEFITDWFKEHTAAMEYHGLYIEINGLQVEGAPIAVENVTFKSEFESFEIKADLINDHFSGMISEIKAGKIKAAGVHLKAIAGNLNAGLALNADSPFG